MNGEEKQRILEMLDTFAEALAVSDAGDGLADLMEEMRRTVNESLERGLGKPLAPRIDEPVLSHADWLRTARRLMEQSACPFSPRNRYDMEFLDLLYQVWNTSAEGLVRSMKTALENLRGRLGGQFDAFVEYFSAYPYWGTFHPDAGDYGTFERRAATLKQHSYDFLWLYQHLEDYLSKRTLTAILRNWAFLETDELARVASIFPDYWEPDIFPDNKDDVLVDAGAYVGDSIADYVAAYGRGYRKIYAYEISAETFPVLCGNLEKMGLPNVIPVQKGVGAERCRMYVRNNPNGDSASRLADSGEQAVEVVALDEDVPEGITFLKMDIEGGEMDALLGCQRTIRERCPKLAVCVYHGYDDLWRIPALIEELNPNYRFYLRHYGENLFPTEFVLLCKPR